MLTANDHLKKLWEAFLYLEPDKGASLVQDLNIDLNRKQKRALLCYFNEGESTDTKTGNIILSNRPFIQILKCLYDLDMVVDSCACKMNPRFRTLILENTILLLDRVKCSKLHALTSAGQKK